MISIYTTKENLVSICLDEKKRPWLDMIFKLKEVFINDDDIFPDEVDPDDDPFYILDGMQIVINFSLMDYINSIPKSPAIVLEHPFGIFLLDIPIEDAKHIQESYGVICQSIKSLDHTPLTQSHFPSELIEGENNKSWSSIVANFKSLPSNSILIIDAHIFAEDKYDEANNCYDSRKRDGIDNIYEILDCILPITLKDTYHVGILITDMDKAKISRRSRSNLTNEHIGTAVNKLKRRLNRNYPINIEVIFFDHNDDGHKLIHNRRILSNYYIITAEYKLAALRNGRSLCGQSIASFPLFEAIDQQPDTDKKEKRIRHEIEQLAEFVERQPNSHTALLCQNGRMLDNFSVLQHRFLKF